MVDWLNVFCSFKMVVHFCPVHAKYILSKSEITVLTCDAYYVALFVYCLFDNIISYINAGKGLQMLSLRSTFINFEQGAVWFVSSGKQPDKSSLRQGYRVVRSVKRVLNGIFGQAPANHDCLFMF